MTAPTPPLRRKRLGQHHLRDPSLCRPATLFLARTAGGARPPVVEIGPGGGALTFALLGAGHAVRAIELDPGWAFYLRREARGSPALQLAVADALAIDWSRLHAGTAIAGNLPYQIATALIEDLLDSVLDGTDAVFLVQREVAERLAAPPGSPAYGSFSVLVQARCRVELLARVRAGSFVPPPKVESAFVGLRFGAFPMPRDEWPSFKATVRAAFGARRKKLRNSLAAAWGRHVAEAAIEAADLLGDRRAETLPLDAFVRLARARRLAP